MKFGKNVAVVPNTALVILSTFILNLNRLFPKLCLRQAV